MKKLLLLLVTSMVLLSMTALPSYASQPNTSSALTLENLATMSFEQIAAALENDYECTVFEDNWLSVKFEDNLIMEEDSCGFICLHAIENRDSTFKIYNTPVTVEGNLSMSMSMQEVVDTANHLRYTPAVIQEGNGDDDYTTWYVSMTVRGNDVRFYWYNFYYDCDLRRNIIIDNYDPYIANPYEIYYEILNTSYNDSDVICTEHKYTSASGDVCTVCGNVFDYALVEYDKTLYAAANNIAVRDKPYAKAGKLVKKLAKGTNVNVKYYFNNSLGSKWYITEDGSYIYSERLTSQSPNEITLRFDGNAPTFSNIPLRIKSTNGTFRIPTDSIPERNGYNFKGWSTNKNAASATYNPGSSFCTNKDTTIYAVWEEAPVYKEYRKKVDALKKNIINKLGSEYEINQMQARLVDYNGNDKVGLCNVSSTVTLFNRKLFYDGKTNEHRLTFIGALKANSVWKIEYKGLNGNDQPCYAFTGGTGDWWHKKYTNSDGTSYQFVRETKATVDKKKGSKSYEEYFKELLRSHPEGIAFRNYTAVHCIVITDYVEDEYGTTFYVNDPVKKYVGPLNSTDCWLYKKIIEKKDSSIFENMDSVVYIK